MKIEFSVAIVTWNRAEELKRAVESCFTQSHKPIEIIIVDNNSSDNTECIVTELLEDSQKYAISIKYLKIHKNIGCPPARNIALANCSGDYIYALDDDGYLDSNALLHIKNTIDLDEENPPLIVSSQIKTPQHENLGFNSLNVCRRNLFSAGACAYRRSYLVKGNYFPEYFRQMEESHFAYNAWFGGEVILFQPKSIMFHEKTAKGRSKYLEVKYNYLNDIENIASQVGLISSIFIFFIKTFSHLRSYLGLKSLMSLMFLKDFPLASFKLLFTKKAINSSLFDYIRFSQGKSR